MTGSGRFGLVIGIEGGGTKTDCLVVDVDGAVRGNGKGGPSNILVVGKEKAKESILSAVQEATQGIGKSARALALCVGAAGSGNPEGRRMMQEALEDLDLAERNLIVHDGVISLMGATAGRPGIVVVAGTGCVCFGMNSKGEFARSSGWGFILGDEGSGYDIARRAMTSSLRAHDGRGPPTSLSDKFVKRLELSTIEDLVKKVYAEAMERHEVSALAPLVLEAAQEGDKVATDILTYAGQELGLAVVAVALRLNMQGEEFQVATMGGILDHFGEFVTGPLRAVIMTSAPRAQIVRARFKPVVGAVIMAAREVGIDVEGDFLAKLAEGAAESANQPS